MQPISRYSGNLKYISVNDATVGVLLDELMVFLRVFHVFRTRTACQRNIEMLKLRFIVLFKTAKC